MANQYVQNTLKIKLSDYKYKIYIMPKGNLCSWGGMGYVGCVDDCRAWISGDLVNVRHRLCAVLLPLHTCGRCARCRTVAIAWSLPA